MSADDHEDASGDGIELATAAPMAEYQRYIHALEKMHGWLEVDLVHNCFLMGEEMGELFKAVRKYNRLFDQGEKGPSDRAAAKENAVEEIVDVMNYLLVIANRLDIDVEQVFRDKNVKNQNRT